MSGYNNLVHKARLSETLVYDRKGSLTLYLLIGIWPLVSAFIIAALLVFRIVDLVECASSYFFRSCKICSFVSRSILLCYVGAVFFKMNCPLFRGCFDGAFPHSLREIVERPDATVLFTSHFFSLSLDVYEARLWATRGTDTKQLAPTLNALRGFCNWHAWR